MPRAHQNAVASSSRQRQNIKAAREEVGSDEEQVAHHGRSNGHAQTDGGHDDEEEDEDDHAGWTVEGFRSLPLSKSNVNNVEVRNLIDQLTAMQQVVMQAIERAVETAKYLADCSPDDEHIETIDKDVQRGIECKEIIGLKIKVLQGMETELFRNGAAFDDAESVFEERSAELEEAYMAQTARQKFKNSKDYIAFRSDLWEVNHDKEAAPAVTQWLPLEDGDEENSEDDFEMGGRTQQYRCPLTLQPFTDAVVSQKCGHHYDRPAIMDLIRQNAVGRRQEPSCTCPQPGCKEKITATDLRTDKQLQKRTDEYEARRKRRLAEEAEEDDEDIVNI